MKGKIKIAYGSVPKDGGTFTFYRNMRPVLENHGIFMYCVAVGKEQADLWEESYADTNTVLLAADTYNIKKQAQSFVRWCETMDIDIVMGINSEAILSAIPHLPVDIRVVSRCANAFEHGYRITMSGKERLQAIFAITPRLQEDLINKYNADFAIMHLIPNGIDPSPFEKASQRERGLSEKLQLGFLGRLEHNQKGVMHLPNLVKNLNALEISFHLSIAGKGADRDKLEKALEPWMKRGQVSFLGALTRTKVPDFLAATDIYIFPSHFEGCPNALLESMMAGCVAMSWEIKGITDYVLQEGETGFLHSVGDCEHMAKNIKRLNENRLLLRRISNLAAEDARLRFSSELAAGAYAFVLKDIMNRPIIDVKPLSWNQFKPDVNFRQKGDPWVPRGLKKKIKNLISFLRD